MRIWGKRAEEERNGASVARAALAGASHEELVQEALRALTQLPCPDRVGIWLELDANAQGPSELSGAFHGLVWDRTAREEIPPKWQVLSLEPPLPEQLLVRPEPFEQNLGGSVGNTVIGQLVGLRRAVWIPIADQWLGCLGRVRGLILLGNLNNSTVSSLNRAKAIAAELALALQAEEESRSVRIRKAELELVRRVVESRSDTSSSDGLLAHLVSDCVRDCARGEGLGASFAAIGVTPSSEERVSSASYADFLWRAGDEIWSRATSTDPLAKLWRQALETRKVVGGEAPAVWPHESVARIVAIPLEAEGRLLGVLLTGLPAAAASLATLGRLELRARLAAVALLRSKRREEESRRNSAEQSLMDLVRDPLFLLDHSGRISATSRGARELLRSAGLGDAAVGSYLGSFFRPRPRKAAEMVSPGSRSCCYGPRRQKGNA